MCTKVDKKLWEISDIKIKNKMELSHVFDTNVEVLLTH